MKQHQTHLALAVFALAVPLSIGAALIHDHEEDQGQDVQEPAPAAATEPAGAQAFQHLKALDGTWKGKLDNQEGTHTFRVSAAGSVVMEMMGPGTGYEMINMYHLDGDDLVLTHYCAAGNQPTMRLAQVSDDGRTLHFEFTGGSNLDPAVDDHIHEATVTLLDDDTIEESWLGYAKGEPAGEPLVFKLHRAE